MQCPTPLEETYQFSVVQSPIEGHYPIHKAVISDAAPRASPQNRATRLGITCHARHPHHPGKCPTAFPSPNLQSKSTFPSTRRSWLTLHRAHHRPSPQNRAMELGATRPSQPPPPPSETPCSISITHPSIEGRWPIHKAAVSNVTLRASPPIATELCHAVERNPPTPTPWEMPCRSSVPQSPIEGRWHVHKVAAIDAAPRPSPPIVAELRHVAGRNPPNPTGSAVPHFYRSICKRGALPRPQGGPSRLPTPSPPLDRRSHRALATRARLYLPEELVALRIAASLPTILVLPPSHLDVAIRSSCSFGGKDGPGC